MVLAMAACSFGWGKFWLRLHGDRYRAPANKSKALALSLNAFN